MKINTSVVLITIIITFENLESFKLIEFEDLKNTCKR